MDGCRQFIFVVSVGLGLLLFLPGCKNKSPYPGGFDSPDPSERLRLIQEAGQDRDKSKIRDLIQQLDHDDGAVRLYGIVALEKITGERYGYQPYDPPGERLTAIARWLEAYPPEDE